MDEYHFEREHGQQFSADPEYAAANMITVGLIQFCWRQRFHGHAGILEEGLRDLGNNV